MVKTKNEQKTYVDKPTYDKIMSNHPIISDDDDLFDVYTKLINFAQSLEECRNDIISASEKVLEQIRDTGATSEEYEIVFDAASKRKVDVQKLRIESPDIFNKIATIKPEAIRDIIGNETCMGLLSEKLGDSDMINDFLQVNITDLSKAVGKSVSDKFMTVERKRSESPIVVKKGTYPGDHYKLGSDKVVEVYVNQEGVKPPKSLSKVKF